MLFFETKHSPSLKIYESVVFGRKHISKASFWNSVLHACHEQARTIAIENELEDISDMKSINCLVLDFLYI